MPRRRVRKTLRIPKGYYRGKGGALCNASGPLAGDLPAPWARLRPPTASNPCLSQGARGHFFYSRGGPSGRPPGALAAPWRRVTRGGAGAALGVLGVGAALRVGHRPPSPRRSAVWRGVAPGPPPLGSIVRLLCGCCMVVVWLLYGCCIGFEWILFDSGLVLGNATQLERVNHPECARVLGCWPCTGGLEVSSGHLPIRPHREHGPANDSS